MDARTSGTATVITVEAMGKNKPTYADTVEQAEQHLTDARAALMGALLYAELTGGTLPYYVLFTQYDKRKGLHRMTAEQVEGAGFPVFDTKIRDNVALGEAPATGNDIFRYAPHSNGAQDYAL